MKEKVVLNRRLKKSLVAMILAVVMVVVNIGYSAITGEGLRELGAKETMPLSKVTDSLEISEIKNGTTDLLKEANPTLEYGDMIIVTMNWTFDDNQKINVDDEYTYQLPDAVLFTPTSGSILDGGKTVGKYTISGNDITVVYTDANFCNGTKRKGKLSFEGKVLDDGTGEKDLTIEFPEVKVSVTVHMVEPSVTPEINVKKSIDRKDLGGHTHMSYVTVISKGNNSSIKLTDEIWPGASMLDAPVITDADGKLLDESRYTYTKINDRMYTVDILSMKNNEEIYLSYPVGVTDEMYSWDSAKKVASDNKKYYSSGYEGWVSSRANVYSAEDPTTDPDPQRHNAWADVTTLKGSFSKWYDPSESVIDKGLMSWTIPVYNIAGTDYTDGYIIDTFPANTSYVEGSLYIKGNSVINNAPVSDYVTVDVKNENGIDVVTFKFTSKLIEYLKTEGNDKVSLKYLLKVDEQHKDVVRYTNHAGLYYNGYLIKDKDESADYKMPEPLTKTGNYNSVTAPYADYTITINPASLNMNPAGDTLTLIDELSASYDLDVASIKLNGITPVSGVVSYDSANHKMTLNLKDSTSYILTYRVRVNLAPGSTLGDDNSANEATLKADDSVIKSVVKKFNTEVYDSAGSSSSVVKSATLEIVKHDSKSNVEVLSGAEFELFEMVVGTEGYVESSSVTATTGADGKAVFNNLQRDIIYMLKETKAPAGYELSSEPSFYAFKYNENTSSLPSSVVYNGKTYGLNVVSAEKVSADYYISNVKEQVPTTTTTTTQEPTTTTTTTQAPTTTTTTTQEPTTTTTTTQEPTTTTTTTQEPTTTTTTTQAPTTTTTTTQAPTTTTTTQEPTTTTTTTQEPTTTTTQEPTTTTQVPTTTAQATTTGTTTTTTQMPTTTQQPRTTAPITFTAPIITYTVPVIVTTTPEVTTTVETTMQVVTTEATTETTATTATTATTRPITTTQPVTEETTVQEITTTSEETVMVTTTTTEETTTTTDDGLIDLFDDDNPMGDVDVDDNGNVGGDDRLPKTGTTPIVYYVGFGLIALILGTVIVSGKREEEN